MCTYPHSFLYRAAALQDCRWDPSIPYHQDRAFAIAATARGLPETIVDCVVGVYREHSGSSVSNGLKPRASPADRAQLQVDLIETGVRNLRESDSLKDHHLEAAAEGMWEQAHLVAAHDLQLFDRIFHRIERIAPGFTPNRRKRTLSFMDKIVGARTTEYLTYPVRRVKYKMTDT